MDVDASSEISPLLLPRDWQQLFEDSLKDTGYNELRPEDCELAKSLGVSTSTLEAMEAISRPDYLKLEYKNFPKDLECYNASVPVPAGVELSALKAARHVIADAASRYWSRSMTDHLPIWHLDCLQGNISTKPDDDRFQVPPTEIVLQVAVCDPTNDFEKVAVNREFLVLGSQPLSALRDKLSCVSDERVLCDQSHNPELQATEKAKERFGGGFFFIENTFYNDTRSPGAADLSQHFIDWIKTTKVTTVNVVADHISTHPMDQVTFHDLPIRLGFPYLYYHQGQCEHIIAFKDLRLVHQDDPQDVRLYPFMCFKNPRVRKACCACHTMTARWMTLNDNFAPSTPCFFCQKCYVALHFDENGLKLGDFQAYEYVDQNHTSLCPKAGVPSSESTT